MTRTSILIVEDDGILALHITDMLTRMGYTPLPPVTTGRQALASVENSDVDLIIMDIELAGPMNGIEAAVHDITKEYDTPVIFVTEFPKALLLQKTKIVSPCDYIFKPIQERELAVTIEMALQRHQLKKQLRETQAALATSEARYRQRFDHAPLGAYMSSPEGTFVSLNLAMARMLGFDSAQEALEHISDIGAQLYFTPSERELFLENLTGRGFVQDFEFRARKINGEIIWLSDTARLEILPGSDSQIISGFIQDITLRKVAEESVQRTTMRLASTVRLLQRLSENLQSFLDAALDEAISLTESRIGYIYHYNEKTQEFSLNSWSRNVMPQCRVAKPQTCYSLAETGLWGEAVRQRKPILVNDYSSGHPLSKGCPEGHIRLTRFLTIPLIMNNAIVAVVGVGNKEMDYTEADILQLQLLMDAVWKAVGQQQAENNYQQLFQSMTAGFALHEIITNENGTPRDYRYLSVNPAFERLTGLRSEDIVGRTVLEIMPDTEPIWIERFGKVALNGDPAKFTSYSKSLGYYYEVSAYCPEPRKFAVIFQDVTELKNTLDRLHATTLRAQELAEQSQAASKAKSEFLANMSHEIRTPLNGIMGMLQLLETTAHNQEQQECCTLALQSANRLTRLLSDILDLSRIEAGKMEIRKDPFCFKETLQEIIDLFMPLTLQSKIKFELYIDSNIPTNVEGDSLRLQQVLTNLIGNAFKFTQQGRITVEAYPLPALEDNQARVFFTVSDTGCGIPDDCLAILFQPFAQAIEGYTRSHQGAGLGLTICKQLVKLMDGNISIESEAGVGTSFHFCATFGILSDSLQQDFSGDVTPQKETPCRVLLAEDDVVTQFAVRKLLEKAGHTVVSAWNGKEAIDLLNVEDFDIILMDIQMPIMDGIEATKKIRTSQTEPKASIPIIALTSYAMAGDRENFLAAGMTDYLSKPTNLADLMRVIANTFNR